MNDDGNFVGFSCGHCHTEIEATLDMVGEETECPACGAKIVVPGKSDGGIERHGLDDESKRLTGALKSRTIRIELDDL